MKVKPKLMVSRMKYKSLQIYDLQLQHAKDSFGDLDGNHELGRDWQGNGESRAKNSLLQFNTLPYPLLKRNN